MLYRAYLVLGLLAAPLAACFSPELGDSPFACLSSGRCPEGYRCLEGVCRRGVAPPADRAMPGEGAPGDLDLSARPERSDLWIGDGPRPDRSSLDLRVDLRSPDQLRKEATVLPPDLGPPIPGSWVTLQAGVFTMGSPASEPCRDASDETQHQVTLTHAFEIMRHEVTQAELKAVTGGSSSPPNHPCADCPVEMIFWDEAAVYLNALSAIRGLQPCYGGCPGSGCAVLPAYAGNKIYSCPGYRFPTEAEWEYAYRAGTTTAYYSGSNNASLCSSSGTADVNLDKIAWYNTATTRSVGQKTANSWLLHDMSGNVWEWVHDWYQADLGSAAVIDPAGPGTGSAHVARGGAFNSTAMMNRAAARSAFPRGQYWEIGFRAARTR